MVVTRHARAVGVLLLTLLVMLGGAGIAAAQDPEPAPPEDDKSLVESTLGATQCATPSGLATAALNEALGAVTGGDTASCLDDVGEVAEAPAQAVQNAANGVFERAGLTFGEAGATGLKYALGWFISIPGQDAGSYQTVLSKVGQYTYDIQVAALILSIIMLGGKLALARSGMIRQVSEEGLRQLARATVVAGSIGFFVVVGTRISDGVATWFLDSTVGDDPAKLVEAMVRLSSFASPGGTALLFAIGIIGLLGGLMMAFLLLMRNGMLVIVSAFLPIVAAAGGTRVGAGAYDKLISWTLAFLLFKPVAAFVIGISAMVFAQSAPSQEQDGGAMGAVIGAMLLACSAFVLPSLMKLLMPQTAGGAGGLAAAAGLTAAAVKVGSMGAGGASAAGLSAAAPSPTAANPGGGDDGWAPSTSSGPVPDSFGVGPSGAGSPSGSTASGADPGSAGPTPAGAAAADSGVQAAGRGAESPQPGQDPTGNSPVPPSFGTGSGGLDSLGGAASAAGSTDSAADSALGRYDTTSDDDRTT
ncbi:hypothetical protein [Rhodococcoides corynebacterioides]|uniref:hypothetical protein n=1 Tax=Rhodococcoides corynebacterioides TaxID=53972 RepID=UPI003AD82590